MTLGYLAGQSETINEESEDDVNEDVHILPHGEFVGKKCKKPLSVFFFKWAPHLAQSPVQGLNSSP